MTKGTLKNLSPRNLPVGWQFEIERAIHFPIKPRIEVIPDREKKDGESIYLSGHKRKESLQVWIKCVPADQEGKKKEYIEITKDAAISWLFEQGYLTTKEDEELKGLIKAYTPPDPIPQFRGTIYDKPLGTGKFFSDPCCK
jgi:hypothetical protein